MSALPPVIPPTNSYQPTHGKTIVGESPERWDDEFSLALQRDRPLMFEYAPVAPASFGSSMAVPNVEPYHYSVRTDEKLADGDPAAFGQFDGPGPHQLTFTSTKQCCKQTNYEFQKNGQPILTGQTTLMNSCSSAPCDFVECLGFVEPFKRNWNISTLNQETVFSFEITPGWLDSQVHAVKNQEGIEIGRIQQPSFVQRVSDMWRQQLQVVVRVVDSKGYERFTLRRRGACGVAQCPYFKKFLPDPSDLCYGRWNLNLGQWVDCDFSKYDLGNCNGLCGQAEQQPCFKCLSCRQACEYRECDVCFTRPGEVCCECDWYHCNLCGADELKCYACPLCKPCCQPGGPGWQDGEPYNCLQDCACCYKPYYDIYATCYTCNCTRGCEFRCCVNNFACCKFTECGANWGGCIKYQCLECVRPLHDCPDCALKLKTFYSKCGPQCKREWNELVAACKQIPTCIKNCIAKCPRRMRQLYCGGREVKIELDVYGPDGDDNLPVCKIVYTGTSGWCCGLATLRPKYVATINIPSVSPYYARWKNEQRACDFVDLALLTSLAIWYDFFTVAPREWFQCAEPLELSGNEIWPEKIYYEWQIDIPRRGEKNYKEPDVVTVFKWLYGDDFAFLLDPRLYVERFSYIQANPAGTLPIKEVLPTARQYGEVEEAAVPVEAVAVQPAASEQPAVEPQQAPAAEANQQ